MNRNGLLRLSLISIGITQLFVGAVFTFAPAHVGALLGLSAAPPWAYWMLSMFGARCFGFAYGMFLAARDPLKHVHWIHSMVGVQAIDWLGTVYYLATGGVTLVQVSSAAYLPLMFIMLLVLLYPRIKEPRIELPAS